MQSAFRLPLAIVAAAGLASCVMGAPEPTPTGAEDFAAYCSACHGTGGAGDGAVAATLAAKPADLTGLAKRNGGTFPSTAVMAKIWGYTGGRDGERVMPQFAALLDGELVLYDGGDGIMTPTPIRLVQLAEHLRLLQQP
jgi:mono/diheme cytochrome c family protein